MTRSTFLASIAAIFTAPFGLKSEKKDPTLPTAQDLIDLENSISPTHRTNSVWKKHISRPIGINWTKEEWEEFHADAEQKEG